MLIVTDSSFIHSFIHDFALHASVARHRHRVLEERRGVREHLLVRHGHAHHAVLAADTHDDDPASGLPSPARVRQPDLE